MLCTVAGDTSGLLAKVNPRDHFNAEWYNKQLNLELPQLPKIAVDTGGAFTAPMRELIYKYADVFRKPGKPIAQDIKHKIEFLDPAKHIPHHRLQRISERDLRDMQKHL